MRVVFVLIFWCFWSAALYASESTVRLLTIGNSFAENSLHYLDDIAKGAGKKVVLFRANLGGHSLEQHAGYLKAYWADPSDPNGRPYSKKFSLVEALQLEKWDYVTIQQVSSLSYRPESYEPFAAELIAVIRMYAPTAEILIHETWAYREDSQTFQKGTLNQRAMYAGLHAAYEQLAAKYRLRIIPVGTAYQKVRANDEWRYRVDTEYDFQNPVFGQLPKDQRDLNVGWKWGRWKSTGEPRFSLDTKHANSAGCYLGGMLFFLTLFPDAPESTFVPKELSIEKVLFLRQVAKETMKTFSQVGKVGPLSPAP